MLASPHHRSVSHNSLYFLQPIVSRFNTGLKNANFFKQMTMVIGAENRIPTAHIP